jgi:hypothetical protein
MPDRRVDLAEAVARAWGEEGILYAVVHGLEAYPWAIARDLDVVLHRRDARRAITAAVAVGREHGFGTVLCRWSYFGLYQLVLIDPERSTALPLDLLCTTDVWRAKWIRLLDATDLARLVAGDGWLGPFRVSHEGRFLKSCVRPLLCGDLSRFGPHLEWPLPVRVPKEVDEPLVRGLLGREGLQALGAHSAAALAERGGDRGALQGRWVRRHPVQALRSVSAAIVGRALRRSLNGAACLFAHTSDSDAAFDAVKALALEARAMFIDLRPCVMPCSRVDRVFQEVTAWRSPPVSEFIVTVVFAPSRWSSQPLVVDAGLLPTARVELPEQVSPEEVRRRLRKAMLALLATAYAPADSLGDSSEAGLVEVGVPW